MLARQRQALILDRVRETGAVRVADLARELEVSDMTVRRDLEILHDHGLLEKVHGGATAISGLASYEPGFVAKSALQQVEKGAIATEAARLVEPGMAIAISAGTTTHALAARVAEIPGVTVVTNSLRVAEVLYRSGRRDQTVILTGGVRTPSEALVGPVRRRPAALGPPRPRVHGRPRDGRQGGLHLPQPVRGRDRPGADRGRPPPRRPRRPHEVGRRRDRVHRASRPGRRPGVRRRAGRRRPRDRCATSWARSSWSSPTSPRRR